MLGEACRVQRPRAGAPLPEPGLHPLSSSASPPVGDMPENDRGRKTRTNLNNGPKSADASVPSGTVELFPIYHREPIKLKTGMSAGCRLSFQPVKLPEFASLTLSRGRQCNDQFAGSLPRMP